MGRRLLAIPLTAAVTLDATTFEVGALTAFQYAAFLLVGLPAGALLGAAVASHLGMLLLPLTTAGSGLIFYVVGAVLSAVGIIGFNIVAVTLRQRVCPDHLLGRMNATMRFAAWGPMTFGALLGGAVGSAVGVRSAIWLALGVAALSLAVLLRPSAVAAVSQAGVRTAAGGAARVPELEHFPPPPAG